MNVVDVTTNEVINIMPAACLFITTVCDYLGEKLAWFFGITTPRYGYVVEEWERMKLEEELEKKTLEKLKKQAEEKRAQRLAQMEGQVL